MPRCLSLLFACSLLAVQCGSLSSTGLLNAHQYLETIEEKKGRQQHEDVKRDFRRMIDKFYAANNDPKDEHHMPVRKLDLVRNFVKSVGPVLGKVGYGEDGPLHDVMQRVNDILGREHDHKAHPHAEATHIVKEMAQFMETVIAAHAQMSKDEL